MARVLLLATTTGYQTRAFGEAAERLGVELVFATDRCKVLDDPWRDEAIAVRFHDDAGSLDAVLASAREQPIDGVLVVGDRPTVLAARVAHALGLPGHPPEAAEAARNKHLTRERLRAARLPVPWFVDVPIDADPDATAATLSFPCVVKPLALSGSRGVMRADDQAGFAAAFRRLRALLASPDVRGERSDLHDTALVEGFIPGREFAVEGLCHHGELQVLAVFDKPDPLDGPFFEETIYLTPSSVPRAAEAAIAEGVARAAAAIGLRHGPVHAECRVNDAGVFVLEVAARPIGGLCARALRFTRGGETIGLEELLLRHALGEAPGAWRREARASGVMMIPIPARGVYRTVSGIDEAQAVAGVEEVKITAKADQVLVPLPEGASYLGFIFARDETSAGVERALRAAHERLRFTIEPELRVVKAR